MRVRPAQGFLILRDEQDDRPTIVSLTVESLSRNELLHRRVRVLESLESGRVAVPATVGEKKKEAHVSLRQRMWRGRETPNVDVFAELDPSEEPAESVEPCQPRPRAEAVFEIPAEMLIDSLDELGPLLLYRGSDLNLDRHAGRSQNHMNRAVTVAVSTFARVRNARRIESGEDLGPLNLTERERLQQEDHVLRLASQLVERRCALLRCLGSSRDNRVLSRPSFATIDSAVFGREATLKNTSSGTPNSEMRVMSNPARNRCSILCSNS
jgi:hypothetical protein